MILKPKLWLIISSLSMIAYIAIIVFLRPQLGIDFTGGSLLEIKSTTLTPDAVAKIAADKLSMPVTAQGTADGTLLIKAPPLDPESHTKLLAELTASDSTMEELRFETVGPTIGAELRRKAWVAILLSLIVTVLYLAYEFRNTSGLVSSWKYGTAATIALIHDLLFVTALFAILGRTHAAPVDALFITAMLALSGYSVNDTIILFNRLKQEWLATRSGSLMIVLDRSVKLTLTRSLNTSIPIFLTLLTLLIFGGSTLRWFIVALIAGTVTGAYSTIFVAPPWLNLLARRR